MKKLIYCLVFVLSLVSVNAQESIYGIQTGVLGF